MQLFRSDNLLWFYRSVHDNIYKICYGFECQPNKFCRFSSLNPSCIFHWRDFKVLGRCPVPVYMVRHNTMTTTQVNWIILASEKYRVTNEHFLLKFKCLKWGKKLGKCKDLNKVGKGQILLDKQYRTKHIQNYSSGWVFFPVFFFSALLLEEKLFAAPPSVAVTHSPQYCCHKLVHAC